MKEKLKKWLGFLRGEPQNIDKLYAKGLKVGDNFQRMGGVIIDPSHCYHITIGDNVTLAPRVHILAHDASFGVFSGKTRAANVTIGNNVFIGASAIVLPGVHIGNRVIIGAGSVVTKNIPDNSVAVGNPARVICTLDDYLAKEEGINISKTELEAIAEQTALERGGRSARLARQVIDSLLSKQ